MIALDTNILARLLLRDDEAQYQTALELLGRDRQYTAPITVMLELVWVLESADCDRQTVARALRLLLDLPNFEPMEFDALLRALDAYERGLDFGDALHMALCAKHKSEAFATADKALAKRAGREGIPPPVELV